MISALDKKYDREANNFAMALLMPETLVKRELDKMKRRARIEHDVSEVIKLLARKFEVDEYLVTIRLQQLGALKGLQL